MALPGRMGGRFPPARDRACYIPVFESRRRQDKYAAKSAVSACGGLSIERPAKQEPPCSEEIDFTQGRGCNHHRIHQLSLARAPGARTGLQIEERT